VHTDDNTVTQNCSRANDRARLDEDGPLSMLHLKFQEARAAATRSALEITGTMVELAMT
jgi:hypothetical protein